MSAGTALWEENAVGVIELPSGRRVRGRGLRRPRPAGQDPTFGLYLLGKPPAAVPWPAEWIEWPDFRTPRRSDDARLALQRAWELAADGRVEIACWGGRGRTGTALSCLAIIDGVPAEQAVQFVRDRYDRRAVETPWQRRFVERFS